MGLSIEEIRSLIRLDSETGDLFWLERDVKWFASHKFLSAEANATRWNKQFAGKPALRNKHRLGYLKGDLFAKATYAHRIVFALHYGRWPVGDVDHIDGDRANNRPNNLRECSRSENCRNQSPRRGSSKFKGVHLMKARGRWMARSTNATGEHVFLGYYRTEEEAALAHDEYAKGAHGEFARLNFPDAGEARQIMRARQAGAKRDRNMNGSEK